MTITVCVRLAQGHINLDPVAEAEGSHKCTPPSSAWIHQLLYEIHHLHFQDLFADLRAIITLGHMLTSVAMTAIVGTHLRTNILHKGWWNLSCALKKWQGIHWQYFFSSEKKTKKLKWSVSMRELFFKIMAHILKGKALVFPVSHASKLGRTKTYLQDSWN